MNKTQKEIIIELLRKHKKVTLRMLFDSGVGYTGRNTISVLKKLGWNIHHYNHNISKGEIISDNAYILISEPVMLKFESNGQLMFI